MKSKFAKFIDSTIGAFLIFAAATAVLRYYTTLELAAFCGVSVAVCAVLLMNLSGKRKSAAQKLSRAADDMFFDFMFSDERAPIRALYAGLKAKEPSAALHGSGIYLNGAAAFCCFDRAPDEKSLARYISKAKHYGANKITVFCRSACGASIDIADYSVRLVGGDDVYRLFASLGALPAHRFEHKRRTRRAAFAGALGKDKIIKYVILAAGFFGMYMLTGTSYVALVCSVTCALLAAAAAITAVVRSVKKQK